MRSWLLLPLILAFGASPLMLTSAAAVEYTDSTSGVTLVVPDDWQRQRPSGGARLFLTHTDSDPLANLGVKLYLEGGHASLQAFEEAVVKRVPGSWKQAGQGPGRVGGQPSRVLRYQFERGGLDWQVEYHLFQHQNRFLRLEFTCFKARAGQAAGPFGDIVRKAKLQ